MLLTTRLTVVEVNHPMGVVILNHPHRGGLYKPPIAGDGGVGRHVRWNDPLAAPVQLADLEYTGMVYRFGTPCGRPPIRIRR